MLTKLLLYLLIINLKRLKMAPPIRKEKLVKITILPATGSTEKTKTVSFLETSQIYKEILKLVGL